MNGLANPRRDQPSTASTEAAHWALRHEEGDLSSAEASAFAAWLAEDEQHLAAYEHALWALDAVARHAGAPEMMALRGAALAARGQRRRFWNWAGFGALAASLAVAAVWIAAPDTPGQGVGERTQVAQVDPDRAVYRTRIGQRSAITLPDGSLATLDTDSEMRIAFDGRKRAVHLLKGQAMFEVAHGRQLPFNVYARGQKITAIGTIFNVRIEGGEVRVAMIEGSVRVGEVAPGGSGAARPEKMLTLTVGEELVAEPARAMVVEAVDTRQVSSWTGGILTFNDIPLADAVAEINRYTTRPIAIADARVGSYRISGVFKSNDPDHFSRAMTEFLPVAVTQSPDGAPVLRARAQ